MRFVAISMSVAVLALGMMVAAASAKAPKNVTADHHQGTHYGTFVSSADGKLVMTGPNGKEHRHAVAKDVKFTIDGKPSTLAAFTKGMHISVTTDKTGNITVVSTVTAKPVAAKPATTTPVTKAAAPIKPASTTPPAKSANK